MSAAELQADLFHYLSQGRRGQCDPYDFGFYLEEWWRDESVRSRDSEFPEQVADLTATQLDEFKQWLVKHEKPAEYARDVPYESPAYLHMDVESKVSRDEWLVHFTRSPFDSFEYGAHLEGLHLSTWRRDRKSAPVDCERNLDLPPFEAVFGFAYRAEQVAVAKAARAYGTHLLLFRAEGAVGVYHYGDEEHQVVFPLCAERDVRHLVYADGELHGETESGEEVTFDSLKTAIAYVEKRKAKAAQLRGVE